MGLLGRKDYDLGPICSGDDLTSLIADGHELGSHTFSHVDCNSISKPRFTEEVGRNAVEVSGIVGAYEMRSFSYPSGLLSLATKHAAGLQFASCRGVNPGINAAHVDLNLVKANKIYSRLGNLDDLIALIKETERVRGWLVFYTHDISDSPSRFGCTTEDFERVVRAAAESNNDILTMRNAVGALAFGF